MAKTFNQMVKEVLAQVPTVNPMMAEKRLQQDRNTLVIDVRDAADIALTRTFPAR